MYNEKLDFIHNIYGLIYCIQMFYLNMLIIFNQTDIVFINSMFDKIFFYSLLYFTISTGINYLDKNHIFVLHHVICMIMLYYGYIYTEPEYLIWMGKTFMAEFSTIFLSLSKTLRYLKKNNVQVPDQVVSYSDNFFIISYFLIRIFYLAPMSISFILNYTFKSIFSIIVPFVALIMIGMNLYWTFLIYKKVMRNVGDDNINIKNSIKFIKKKFKKLSSKH